MVMPLSQSALLQHERLKRAEGGTRVIREWTTFPGYSVALCYVAGAHVLVIAPVPRPLGSWNVGIPVRELATYLKENGSVEYHEVEKDAPRWLRQMGREVSEAETRKLAGIFADTWSDIYNPKPIRTTINATADPVAEIEIHRSDRDNPDKVLV